jgi:hypothetical protein
VGTPREPLSVTTIVGVLAASRGLLAEAARVVAADIAPIALASEPAEWTASGYYRTEMGDEIWRQFLSLDECRAPGELAALKLRTNRLEDRWRTPHGRRVNLDPGYVDLLRLVLASTKDAAQRVYLGSGIYAEAALRYANGRFEPWPYTYPDYAAAPAIEFFNRVRERLRESRRSETRPPDRRAG